MLRPNSFNGLPHSFNAYPHPQQRMHKNAQTQKKCEFLASFERGQGYKRHVVQIISTEKVVNSIFLE